MQYTGTGSFGVTRDFTIASRGTGSSEGERVILNRPGDGRASRGEYELGPFGSGDDDTFTGFYHRRTLDGVKEKFVVTSGRIQIFTSSDERVDGTFRFTAEPFCSTPADVDQSIGCHPATRVHGSPILMEGTFSVGPHGAICPGVILADGSSPRS